MTTAFQTTVEKLGYKLESYKYNGKDECLALFCDDAAKTCGDIMVEAIDSMTDDHALDALYQIGRMLRKSETRSGTWPNTRQGNGKNKNLFCSCVIFWQEYQLDTP